MLLALRFSEHLSRTWHEQGGRTSHSSCEYVARTQRLGVSGCAYRTLRRWLVSGTCCQRAYNVRSMCDCHVNVRSQYLYALLVYGVLSPTHVVTACKCVYFGRCWLIYIKRPIDAPQKSQLPLPWNVDHTTADIVESAASGAACSDTAGNRRLILCVVSTEHVLAR